MKKGTFDIHSLNFIGMMTDVIELEEVAALQLD